MKKIEGDEKLLKGKQNISDIMHKNPNDIGFALNFKIG